MQILHKITNYDSLILYQVTTVLHNCFRFQRTIRIPGIIGLIDCMIVKIIKAEPNEEAFIHRVHKHSLKVQIVSF